MPGDRAANCGGLMRPIGYFNHSKKGIVIEFQCELCKEKKVNKASLSDPLAADNYDLLLTCNSRKNKHKFY